MSFADPATLLLLLLVPLFATGYVLLQRHRRNQAPAMGVVEGARALSRRPGRRRHVAPALFLSAIAVLLVGAARPHVEGFPRREGTVILAIDVSNSMLAADLEPSRLEAAKVAAHAFVERQPSSIQIGLVAFGESAFVVQQPTDVRDDVVAAIERLSAEGGTSLGEGIITSLGAIAGEPILVDPAEDLSALDIGYFGSAAIVLLSDGEDAARLDPLTAADLAGNAGVRIFPVGVGSAEGATVEIDGYTVATSLDEETLAEIADRTGGAYFAAQDAPSLVEIYDSIDLDFAVDGEPTEVTSLVAAFGCLLLLVGGALTMRWFGRVP